MQLKKWKLLSKKDVSPNAWFPIESRTYQMPNGKIVEDFTVTTISDVSLIIPVTKDGQIVMIKQYKPGIDEIMIQIPGGRLEDRHNQDFDHLAQEELEEETGIKVELSQLTQVGKLASSSTKSSETVYFYIAKNCEFNTEQRLDPTEEIETLLLRPKKIDEMIRLGEIWCAVTIAGWDLAKKRFPELLGVK